MRNLFLYGAVAGIVLTPLAASAQTIINNTIINNNTNGNGNGNNIDQGQAAYWRNDPRRLEAWLYTDRTNYRAGSGVQLRLTLTNLSNKTSVMQLPRRGEYTITITDTRTNRVVWSRDRSRSGGGTLQLNAGGTGQWVEFWDQRDNAGNTVPMGAYRIDARVIDLLPVSVQVFLSDRNADRPQPENGNGNNGNGNGNGNNGGWNNGNGNNGGGNNGNNGNGGIVTPDPVTGPVGGGMLPGRNNGGNGQQAANSGVIGSVTLTQTSVHPGDVVKFTYTVTNTNRQPITLNFSSSQIFDVWATVATRTPTARNTPVWRLGDGVAWAQMLQQITLQPGEQRSFQGSWRIANDLTPGQSLDVNASLTPMRTAVGTVAAARARLTIN